MPDSSPIQYLNQTRLKRAQHLLEKYQLFVFLILRPPPVFSSQSLFYTVFSESNFNMTPVKYRQEHDKEFKFYI